ncbi:hypothetical protein SDC9_198696 [bioreactor metagenome]|uniref:Uncharacterized protein n=1 Tax=bioreactor metagenome TaxID=1076179 RepID=A0A645IIE1_9ZZZZ
MAIIVFAPVVFALSREFLNLIASLSYTFKSSSVNFVSFGQSQPLVPQIT